MRKNNIDKKGEKGFRNPKEECDIPTEEKLRRKRRNETIVSAVIICLALFLTYEFFFTTTVTLKHAIFSLAIILYLLFTGLRPILHHAAVRNNWTRLASWFASDADKEEELVRKREQKMASHHDDGILILATESGDICSILDYYAAVHATDHINNIAQLWQCDSQSYAITFPCGVARLPLMDLLYDLADECSDVRLWVPSHVTKRTTGNWTFVTVNSDYMIVAASDDGRQWIVPEEDEEQFLFKETDIHQIDFQPYPNVILSSDRKRELFY